MKGGTPKIGSGGMYEEFMFLQGSWLLELTFFSNKNNLNTHDDIYISYSKNYFIKTLKIFGVQHQIPIRFGTALERYKILKVRNPTPYKRIFNLYYPLAQQNTTKFDTKIVFMM